MRQDLLEAALSDRGLRSHRRDGAVVVNGSSHRLRLEEEHRMAGGLTHCRLTLKVELGGRAFIEPAQGCGADTHEARAKAAERLGEELLPALSVALWGAEEGARTTTMRLDGQDWHVHAGACFRRGDARVPFPMPVGTFATLERLLRAVRADGSVHRLRWSCTRRPGRRPVARVRFDEHRWERGAELLGELRWPEALRGWELGQLMVLTRPGAGALVALEDVRGEGDEDDEDEEQPRSLAG